MKLKLLLILICSTFALSGQQFIGSIEVLDPLMEELISPSERIEILAKGFKWAEGPLWVPQLNGLLFTDVPENKIYLWTEKEGLKLFLSPSGMTNHAPHSTNEGANGLALDSDGKLVLCQHGNRAVARLKDWNTDKPEFEFLIDHYDGKWLNSPNDLAFDKSGKLFFTDPPYGLGSQDADPIKELDFNGIYSLTKSGNVQLLDRSLKRPNGIALSKDEKTLYVGNSDGQNSIVAAFDLKNGTLENKRVFFDGNELGKTRRGLFDGLKVHSSGVIFATGPGGVLLLDKNGKHLGTIMPGKSTANCGFDPDEKYLYLTATNVLARVKLK